MSDYFDALEQELRAAVPRAARARTSRFGRFGRTPYGLAAFFIALLAPLAVGLSLLLANAGNSTPIHPHAPAHRPARLTHNQGKRHPAPRRRHLIALYQAMEAARRRYVRTGADVQVRLVQRPQPPLMLGGSLLRIAAATTAGTPVFLAPVIRRVVRGAPRPVGQSSSLGPPDNPHGISLPVSLRSGRRDVVHHSNRTRRDQAVAGSPTFIAAARPSRTHPCEGQEHRPVFTVRPRRTASLCDRAPNTLDRGTTTKRGALIGFSPHPDLANEPTTALTRQPPTSACSVCSARPVSS